jgi:hypothetical protein
MKAKLMERFPFKILILFLISRILIEPWKSQIVVDANPSSVDVYIQEEVTITLDGNQNAINGAACIASFELASNSPSSPSWATNAGLTLNFNPSTIFDAGTYELQYEVIESGTGSCTFVPHNRRIAINVIKRPPVVSYDIPDYLNLRTAVSFEIIFPQSVCTDPYGDSLTYYMLDQNDAAVSQSINFDQTGNGRLYGVMPNAQAGSYILKMYWVDSKSQSVQQQFSLYFAANNSPNRVIFDLTPYEFEIPEGVNTTYILPVGIYVDPDGDVINYDMWFFENFQALSTVTWATFYSGSEGVSYLEFIEPTSTTHTGFNFMLSDGISSSTGPVLINFTFNQSPIVSPSSLDITIYPNETFTIQIELSTYFTDPESQTLTFSSKNLPTEVTTTALSFTQFQINADFTSSFPSSDLTFFFSASDGASKATDFQVMC